MKTYPKTLLALLLACTPVLRAADSETTAIPLSGIGAKATADYKGDAIGITSTATGASLRSGFQKLEADASADGLWLHSTEPGGQGKFRIIATGVGRGDSKVDFPSTGSVSVADGLVSFLRSGVIEEYSSSMDGIRQDFVLTEKPAGLGELDLNLGLAEATAKQYANGAIITLSDSKRELTYSRLHVTDATGRELTASMEVTADDALQIHIDDQAAVYPVRIDPTFSDADWYSMGQSPEISNGSVHALAVIGTDLYVAGGFAKAGGVTVNNIAKWNGTEWSALGTGMDDSVYALAVSGTDLYAGGYFTLAGGAVAYRVAKWNGTAWSGLGAGMNQPVRALAVSGTDLYAGGSFTTAGGVAASRIAKWNGTIWSALGMGMDQNVSALGVSGTNLYAAGDFSIAGSVAVNRIAKWNGTAWSALGSGIGPAGFVYAIAVSGTDVYVGGSFFEAGGVSTGSITKWNGSAWSALGAGGVGGSVNALVVSGGNLYAGGGTLSIAGGVAVNRVAKWNGTAWSALGSGTSSFVEALAVVGTNLFVGGDSPSKWDGTNWSALGSGPNGEVKAVAVSGTDLYIGGSFNIAGGVSANNIAKWNGSTWSPLGAGVNSYVNALAFVGTNLYAGGYFTSAGGVTANQIAKWDGTAWTAVGAGVNDEVYALKSSGTDLYAGGKFTIAGLVAASRIAKWDGIAWSALGSGVSSGGGYSVVQALATIGPDLYAGGQFNTAGGITAFGIAKWNGTWNSLGGGPTGVSALAVSGANLYAADGSVVSKWNGSAWTALPAFGTGYYSYVLSLATSGSDLYAGGVFDAAGGSAAQRIAKWNGVAWSPLGSGISIYNSQVNALAVVGEELYVAGKFEGAGGKASSNVARAHIGPPPIPAPEIDIDQAGGNIAINGTKSFGGVATGANSPLIFTVKNTGNANLNLTGTPKVTVTGSGDFTITAQPSSPITAPSGTSTFTVRFSPTSSGAKAAALSISNDDADENPFAINLTGTGLSFTTDTDGDGLNDAAEYNLAALGFDWQVSQPSLVGTLNTNAGGAGLYTTSQVRALNIDVPLIQKDAGTGQFKLTLGLEKSTNLSSFNAFPFSAPQTTVNGQGKIEFLFTSPDGAAFFRVKGN